MHDANWDTFRAASDKGGKHVVVKAGDKVPIKGIDALVLSAAGKTTAKLVKGGGAANPACASIEKRAVDDAEDGQSVGPAEPRLLQNTGPAVVFENYADLEERINDETLCVDRDCTDGKQYGDGLAGSGLPLGRHLPVPGARTADGLEL